MAGDIEDLVAATAAATEERMCAPGSTAEEVAAAAPLISLRDYVSELTCATIAAGDAPATPTRYHTPAAAAIVAATGSADHEAHFYTRYQLYFPF